MLSFASAPGNLFNRIGKCGLLVSEMDSYQTTQNTNIIDTTNGVVAQYNAEPDLQAIAGSNYQSVLSSVESVGSIAQQLAQATINRMVFRDNPQINQTLNNANLITSILEVIRQMQVEGATVLQTAVSTTPAAFVGTGNGVLVASPYRPSDGRMCENSFSETVQVFCSQDSYTGGATQFYEGFMANGEGQETDVFAFDWPLGSNASTTFNAINPNANNSNGNILTNSNFSSFTGNTPNNWVITVGTAGTQFFKESSIVFGTGNALRILGDGTPNVTWWQQFGNSGGTPGTLSPLSQYSICFFLRRDGSVSSAGILTVDLCNAQGQTLKDANGKSNLFTIDLTKLTTVYTGYTGVFRTPLILPSTYYLRFTVSTPYDTGKSFYLDTGGLGAMTQLYTSGPSFGVHSGSSAFVAGDLASCSVVNARGSGGSLNTFQTLWDRFCNMRQNDLLLPSSTNPSISDTLIG